MKKHPLKIFHLPDYQRDNPYQKLLVKNLSAIGFDVKIKKKKVYFKIFDVSIIYNLSRGFKRNIFHLHWQHPFLLHKNRLLMVLKGTIFTGQLFIMKVLGVKIIWTVHNLKNHENKNRDIENIFCIIIAKIANGIIAHCDASKLNILALYKIKENKVYSIPQGNYLNVYRGDHTRQESKEILGLNDNDFTFLFFGLIRPYKGILRLIESFQTVSSESARLIIAGRIEDKKHTELLRKKAKNDYRIKLKFGYIDNDKIAIYLKAADIVVLPYEDIINSGSAILGMSYGKVIIAPRIGCIPEILKNQYDMLYDPAKPNSLAKKIEKALINKEKIKEIGTRNLETAKLLNWKKIAERTGQVYLNSFKKR